VLLSKTFNNANIYGEYWGSQMGKGSYLGGSTLGYGDVKKNTGKASRFSSKMMEAYNLRTMTAAERKAYHRNKMRKKQALAAASAANKKVVATKQDVQMLPTLKPGDLVPASQLKSMIREAKAACSRTSLHKKR
jgi:hypothetical protein